MTCHSTPNVFNNLSNVEALGDATRPPNFPSFAPAVARLFDVGVAEHNRHGLRFTHDNGDGTFSPIVLRLANQDGSTTMLTVTFDPGLGLITGKVEDIGRFKVPQLRGVKNNAPYFHDNSAATLEEVVDYFNSDLYNSSKDGRRFPIHLGARERSDLLAFLDIL
jgi:cytochrome c peroxidase